MCLSCSGSAAIIPAHDLFCGKCGSMCHYGRQCGQLPSVTTGAGVTIDAPPIHPTPLLQLGGYMLPVTYGPPMPVAYGHPMLVASGPPLMPPFLYGGTPIRGFGGVAIGGFGGVTFNGRPA
jgi:hypothetical protein